MTEALSQELQDALAAQDQAIAGIASELATLVAQVNLLDNGGLQAELVTEIQNRTAAINAATQAAASAQSSTAAGTPTAPDTTVATGAATDLPSASSTDASSTAPSTPVDTAMGDAAAPDDASVSGGGSPMG